MGTRHLTMVVTNNQTKVAQYGQWDGYPSGQGITILGFLEEMNFKEVLGKNLFPAQLEKTKFVDDEKQKEIDDFLKSIGCSDGWMNEDQAKKYKEKYPYFSRDIGADILNRILKSEDDVIWLQDNSLFAGDGLFCEWAYVIDLGERTLEVYKGFGTTPLDPTERFYHLTENKTNEYHPVSLAKKYSLYELPSKEDFIKDFEEPDEEDLE